jgi:hypothetical protein
MFPEVERHFRGHDDFAFTMGTVDPFNNLEDRWHVEKRSNLFLID